jgi:hypothetical protein
MYDGMNGGYYLPTHSSIRATFTNITSLTITAITFTIERRADKRSTDYEVRDFQPQPDYRTAPPGAIPGLTVGGDPLASHMIRPGETKNMEFQINEVPTAPALFFYEFAWHILSARGF